MIGVHCGCGMLLELLCAVLSTAIIQDGATLYLLLDSTQTNKLTPRPLEPFSFSILLAATVFVITSYPTGTSADTSVAS